MGNAGDFGCTSMNSHQWDTWIENIQNDKSNRTNQQNPTDLMILHDIAACNQYQGASKTGNSSNPPSMTWDVQGLNMASKALELEVVVVLRLPHQMFVIYPIWSSPPS